jgi:hypothetical protein
MSIASGADDGTARRAGWRTATRDRRFSRLHESGGSRCVRPKAPVGRRVAIKSSMKRQDFRLVGVAVNHCSAQDARTRPSRSARPKPRTRVRPTG